jgi:hypothetical protein
MQNEPLATMLVIDFGYLKCQLDECPETYRRPDFKTQTLQEHIVKIRQAAQQAGWGALNLHISSSSMESGPDLYIDLCPKHFKEIRNAKITLVLSGLSVQ